MATFLRILRIPANVFRGYSGKSVFAKDHNIVRKYTVPSNHVLSTSNYATNAAASNFAVHEQSVQSPIFLKPSSQPFEVMVAKLQSHLSFYDTIQEKDLEDVMIRVKELGHAPASSALFLIHCCGNTLSYVSNKKRMELLHTMWESLNKKKLDISHYNALLQAYIENEHDFCPLEFLKLLKEENIEPNRVTLQKLISQYCLKGNMSGATEILDFMKEKELPLSPMIFHSLIVGHSEANKLDEAIKILDVMKQSGVETTSETYGALLQAYAKHGKIDEIMEVIENCKKNEVLLTDKSLLKAIYVLALNGYEEHADQILSVMPRYNKYAINASDVIFKLAEKKYDDLALKILLTIPNEMGRRRGPVQGIYSAYVHSMMDKKYPDDKIIETCKLICDQITPTIYQSTLRACLGTKKVNLAFKLMALMKEKNLPVREHYFWPILAREAEKLNLKGLQEILRKMKGQFQITPSLMTLRRYVLPYVTGDLRTAMIFLRDAGLPRKMTINALVSHALLERKFKTALVIVRRNPSVELAVDLVKPAVSVIDYYNDHDTFLEIIRHINENNTTNINIDDSSVVEEPEKLPFLDYVALTVARMLPHFKQSSMTMVYENMIKEGLGISKETAEMIKTHLGKSIDDTLSSALDKLSAGDLTPKPFERPHVSKQDIMHYKISELCEENKEEEALQAYETSKIEGHEFKPGTFISMVHMYIRMGNLEKAREWMNVFLENHVDCPLHMKVIVGYTHLLVSSELYDEALKFLETVKVGQLTGSSKRLKFEIVHKLASTGNFELVCKFWNILETEKFDLVHVLAALVKEPMDKQDYQTALEKFEWVCTNLNRIRYGFDLMKVFINNNDAASLQKVVNICTSIIGESKALCDLCMAFLECGRLNQAKKILQTPGFVVPNKYFERSAAYSRSQDKEKHLLLVIEVTKQLQSVNRQELYQTLLEYYSEKQDWQKGLALWTQMQEEDCIPTNSFLSTLRTLLEGNEQPVPFA